VLILVLGQKRGGGMDKNDNLTLGIFVNFLPYNDPKLYLSVLV
jgi:hypothetical protein